MSFIFLKKNIKILLLSTVVLAIETVTSYFINDPGFISIGFIPFLIVPLLITLYYGRRLGIISYTLTTVFLFISNEFSRGNLTINQYLKELSPILGSLLIVSYLLSIIVGNYREQIHKLEERLRKISIDNLRFKRVSRSLKVVNSEFETRLIRSKESITSLYNQIEKLGRLNSDYIVKEYLETIALFTMADKSAVWYYDDNRNKLVLKYSYGYYDTPLDQYLSIENSIEGFVFRNNQFFSIRKISDYQSLKISQAKNNIITIPINIGGRVWGVMNIQSMPFEKYSRYSEQLIHIITNLTEPYLSKALDFERMIKVNDLDASNNLPFYSQFYSFLEDQLSTCWINKNSLSLMIMELTNFEDLIKDHNTNEVKGLFTTITISAFKDAGHDFFFFNYKNSNQIAVISTNLDFDGVAFYCVRLYKKFNSGDHSIKSQSVKLDLCIGYATQKDMELSPASIIDQAENLLNMAKL